MKAIICDKCKVTSAKVEDLKKNIVTFKLSTEEVGAFDHRHLCMRCVRKFNSWLGEDDTE